MNMKPWLHAPPHRFYEAGTYMVTGSTLNKALLFNKKEELDLLHNLLLELAAHYQWSLIAWAIFPNHYHFIARSPENPKTLRKFITHLHATSARKLNQLHKTSGRSVWYQYWDSKITFETSYIARINYVMQNPVKHKIVLNAEEYPWCSVSWFKKNVSKAYFDTVMSLNSDDVNVVDDF